MGELIGLIVVATSIWVYFDARALGARRGLQSGLADMSPLGWALASLLLWIVAFPFYVANRGALRDAAQKNPARRFSGKWR